jgi:hypothetical protein
MSNHQREKCKIRPQRGTPQLGTGSNLSNRETEVDSAKVQNSRSRWRIRSMSPIPEYPSWSLTETTTCCLLAIELVNLIIWNLGKQSKKERSTYWWFKCSEGTAIGFPYFLTAWTRHLNGLMVCFFKETYESPYMKYKQIRSNLIWLKGRK